MLEMRIFYKMQSVCQFDQGILELFSKAIGSKFISTYELYMNLSYM